MNWRIIVSVPMLLATALTSCLVDTDIEEPAPKEFEATFESDLLSVDSIGRVSRSAYGNCVDAALFAGCTDVSRYAISSTDGGGRVTLVRQSESESGEKIDCNIAYIPYTDRITCYEGSVSVELPTTQQYTGRSIDNGYLPMIAATSTSGQRKLYFKHICGILKIELKSDISVRSITLSGNNGEKLAGVCTITAGETVDPSIKTYAISSASVTLDCTDAAAAESRPVEFWIAIPPTRFERGITLKLLTADGAESGITIDRAIEVERAGQTVVAIEQSESDRQLSSTETYTSTDYSQNGETVSIAQHSLGTGIDVVLLGDAFTDLDIENGTYDRVMRSAADHLFDEEPLLSLRDRFDVNYVKVVSANGCYTACSSTALGTYFADSNSTCTGGNDKKVFDYAALAGGEDMGRKLIVVVMNSTRYAGTSYLYYTGETIAYLPMGSDDQVFGELICHEAAGHGLGRLLDEYCYVGSITDTAITTFVEEQRMGWGANVDITSDPDKIGWSDMLADSDYKESVGVFEGALTYSTGAWRPTQQSIMNQNCGGFNAPSRRELYKRIMESSGEQYSREQFKLFDAKRNSQKVAATRNAVSFAPLPPPVRCTRD